jgi:hypothetical protein
MWKKVGRLCGLVVRVPGYITEMYCASCEVRTEFIYVMWKKVGRLCGLVGETLEQMLLNRQKSNLHIN